MASEDFIFRIGMDISKFEKSISDVDKELTKWKDSLKDLKGNALVQANQTIDQLTQSIKDLKEVGLDKLKKPTQDAGYALSTFNGVVRDLPFGFVAIQNNLPMVVDSFTQLSKQSGGAKNALSNLSAALTGPAGLAFAFGAVITGVTSLVQKYGSLSAALTDIFGIQQSYNSLLNTYNQKIAESTSNGQAEALSLNNLAGILTDSTKTLNQRTGAYQEINKEYPGLLTNISLESSLTESGNKLLKDRIDLYTKQIILQAKQDSLIKLISGAYEDQNKALADFTGGDYFNLLGMQLKGLVQGDVNPATQAITSLSNTFKRSGKQIDFYNGILKDLQKETTAVNAEVEALATAEQKKAKAEKEAAEAAKKALEIEKEKNRVLFNRNLIEETYSKIRIKEITQGGANSKIKFTDKVSKGLSDSLKNITTKLEGTKSPLDYLIPKPEDFRKSLTDVELALADTTQRLEEVFFNPLTDLFSNFFETGKFAFQDFTKAIIKSINQVVAKIIATGIIQLLANILTPGAGGALGGKTGNKFITDIVNSVIGAKTVAAPTFAGVGGGLMGMSGSVNLTLRGTDLVGAINRTNTNISRVG